MKPCENIRPHLGALVDGELEPFEAMAVRRHLAKCAECAAEIESIEQLKLNLHVSGHGAELSKASKARMRGAIRALAQETQREERSRRWVMPVAASIAALAVAAGVWLTVQPSAEATSEAAAVAELAGLDLDGDALHKLVDVHHGVQPAGWFPEFQRHGALVAFERLPGSFINQEGERSRVVPASFVGCADTARGSSLAVLRADRVKLPVEIQSSLDETGVYVEVVEGTEIRVSVSGEKVFVLLSDIGPVGGVAPI